jgi:hypothetical protein
MHNQLVEGQPGQNGVVYDEPVSDMSLALGMHNPNRSRWYQGWFYEFVSSPFPLLFETDFQKWTQHEWEYLGEGYNLDMALGFVIDEQTEFGPDAPVNNYRLYGQGLITDIKLQRW